MKKLSLTLIVFLSSCMMGKIEKGPEGVIKGGYKLEVVKAETINSTNKIPWDFDSKTLSNGDLYKVGFGKIYNDLVVYFKLTKIEDNLIGSSNSFLFSVVNSSDKDLEDSYKIFEINENYNGCKDKNLNINDSCTIKMTVRYQGGLKNELQTKDGDFLVFKLTEDIETTLEKAIEFEVEMGVYRKDNSVVNFSFDDSFVLDFGDLGFFDAKTNSDLTDAGISYNVDGELDIVAVGYEVINNDISKEALSASCNGSDRSKSCLVTFNGKKGVGRNFTNDPAFLKLSIALENGVTEVKQIPIKGKRLTAPNLIITPDEGDFNSNKLTENFIIKNTGETSVTLAACDLNLPPNYPSGVFTSTNLNNCANKELAQNVQTNVTVVFDKDNQNVVPGTRYEGGKLFVNSVNHNEELGKSVKIEGGVNDPAILTIKRNGTEYENGGVPYVFTSTIVGNELPIDFIVHKVGELSASQVSFSLSNTTDFEFLETCSNSITADCGLNIKFKPQGTNSLKSGSLTINYNNGIENTSYVLNIKGQAQYKAELKFYETSTCASETDAINFNTVAKGVDTFKSIYFKRTGDVSASSVSKTAPNTPFSVVTVFPAPSYSISDSNCHELQTKIHPLSNGDFSSSFVVSYNDGVTNISKTINLSAKTPAELVIQAANYSFGNILNPFMYCDSGCSNVSESCTLGSCPNDYYKAKDSIVSIKNIGKTGAILSSIISALSSYFTVSSNTCTGILASDATCSVTVKFNSSSYQTQTNGVQILSNNKFTLPYNNGVASKSLVSADFTGTILVPGKVDVDTQTFPDPAIYSIGANVGTSKTISVTTTTGSNTTPVTLTSVAVASPFSASISGAKINLTFAPTETQDYLVSKCQCEVPANHPYDGTRGCTVTAACVKDDKSATATLNYTFGLKNSGNSLIPATDTFLLSAVSVMRAKLIITNMSKQVEDTNHNYIKSFPKIIYDSGQYKYNGSPVSDLPFFWDFDKELKGEDVVFNNLQITIKNIGGYTASSISLDLQNSNETDFKAMGVTASLSSLNPNTFDIYFSPLELADPHETSEKLGALYKVNYNNGVGATDLKYHDYKSQKLDLKGYSITKPSLDVAFLQNSETTNNNSLELFHGFGTQNTDIDLEYKVTLIPPTVEVPAPYSTNMPNNQGYYILTKVTEPTLVNFFGGNATSALRSKLPQELSISGELALTSGPLSSNQNTSLNINNIKFIDTGNNLCAFYSSYVSTTYSFSDYNKFLATPAINITVPNDENKNKLKVVARPRVSFKNTNNTTDNSYCKATIDSVSGEANVFIKTKDVGFNFAQPTAVFDGSLTVAGFEINEGNSGIDDCLLSDGTMTFEGKNECKVFVNNTGAYDEYAGFVQEADVYNNNNLLEFKIIKNATTEADISKILINGVLKDVGRETSNTNFHCIKNVYFLDLFSETKNGLNHGVFNLDSTYIQKFNSVGDPNDVKGSVSMCSKAGQYFDLMLQACNSASDVLIKSDTASYHPVTNGPCSDVFNQNIFLHSKIVVGSNSFEYFVGNIDKGVINGSFVRTTNNGGQGMTQLFFQVTLNVLGKSGSTNITRPVGIYNSNLASDAMGLVFGENDCQ